MNRKFFQFVSSVAILFCFSASMAQSPDTLELKGIVVQDPAIDALVMKHIRINDHFQTIDGFRVQLFSDSGNNSKNKAHAVYNAFVLKYPETGAYLSFISPNYKVRVGDFRTRLDAQRFLLELAVDYPNAFIVEEPIHLPQTE